MTTWKKGIHILDEIEQNSTILDDNTIHYNYLCKSIKARLYCNMAWKILFDSSYNTVLTSSDDNDDLNDKVQQQPLKEDELKIASEYAGLALKLYDEIMVIDGTNNETLKPIMDRALGLAASCCTRAGTAVTTEELLQSALDLYKKREMIMLNIRVFTVRIRIRIRIRMIVPIDSRRIFPYYSSLCRNWDKRGADAKQNEENVLDINTNL